MSEDIYYLAHPYSGNEEQNVKDSIYYTNRLLNKGYNIFNPLTHSHYLHQNESRDPQFWYDLDIRFLSRCDGIILAPGWTESYGCRKEFKYALAMCKCSKFKILFYEDIKKEGS